MRFSVHAESPSNATSALSSLPLSFKGAEKTANSDGMRKCVVPSDILAFVVVHVFSYTFADRYKHAYVGMYVCIIWLKIEAERSVMLPVFGEMLSVTHVQYQLSSVLVHWGTHPDAGHYTALLYSSHDHMVYHADDNNPGYRISEEEADRMGTDSYLFLYTKCQ